MHRTVAAALVAALLGLGVASCGGSESTTLNGNALVRRIELACREGQKAAREKLRSASRSNNGEGFAEVILASENAVRDKLDGVTTSGATKADFEAFKQTLDRRVELVEKLTGLDRAEREAMTRRLQSQIEATTEKLQELTRTFDIEGCI